MSSSFHHSIRNGLLLITLSLLLLISEGLYRYFFAVQMTAKNLTEELFFILFLYQFFAFAKFTITRIIVVTFFFLCCAANNIHYAIYQSWINAVNYYLSFVELSEVTNAIPSYIDKALIPVIWSIVDACIFCSAALIIKEKRKFVACDLLFFIAIAIISIRSINTRQEQGISPKDIYGRVKSNFFVTGYLLGRTIPTSLLNLSSVPIYLQSAPISSASPKVKNIVLLMGESATSKHWSSFGYKRKTTPYLDQLKSEVLGASLFLTECRSAGMMTAVSLPYFINSIPKPNGLNQIVSGRTNLLRLAQAQNMETFWFTAQPESEMNIINLIGKAYIDHLTYPSTLTGGGVKEVARDDVLIDQLKNIDFNSSNGKFIVLHQRGSHVPYGKLLNNEELIFGTDNANNMYDNTIIHTDHIIQKILTYLKSLKSKDWIFIHTSDHGQFVKGEIANQGMANNEDSYTVPLVIYSENKKHIELATQDIQAPAVPYQYQLAVYIMHLMGYDDVPSDKGAVGYVTGNLITGDAGYLKFEGSSEPEFIKP